MTEQNFSEEDKQKFIDFLNMIAEHSTFTLKTDKLIEYFKLLAHMQQKVLPKIDAHILEKIRVTQPPPPAPREPKTRAKK